MSDVTTDTMMHSVAAGIAVDIAEEGFDRVSAILSGIPGGANRAVGSALARAAAAGKTVAKRAVTQEYAISSSEFTNRTKNVNNIQRASSGPRFRGENGFSLWYLREAGRKKIPG